MAAQTDGRTGTAGIGTLPVTITLTPVAEGPLIEGGTVITVNEGHTGTLARTRSATIWVSYILGAPEFVNQSFRELFADGTPVARPLVAKGEEPSEADLDGGSTAGN